MGEGTLLRAANRRLGTTRRRRFETSSTIETLLLDFDPQVNRAAGPSGDAKTPYYVLDAWVEKSVTLPERGQSGGGWKRLDGIDLLRGVAIFFVLMNHVNARLQIARVPYLDGIPKQLAASLVWNGQRGVHMFFAVSGFLITSITLRRWETLSKIRVRDFYKLRFARIAPLLLLLLAVLSGLHFAGAKHYVVSAKTGGLGRALLAGSGGETCVDD